MGHAGLCRHVIMVECRTILNGITCTDKPVHIPNTAYNSTIELINVECILAFITFLDTALLDH